MKVEFLSGSVFIYYRCHADFLFDISHSDKGFDCHYDNDYNCTVVSRYPENRNKACIDKDTLVWILLQIVKRYNIKRLKFVNYYPCGTDQEIFNEIKKLLEDEKL